MDEWQRLKRMQRRRQRVRVRWLVGIVVLLFIVGSLAVILTSGGGAGLESNEKTSTSVVRTNVAIENQYNATVTSLAMIDLASQTAVRNDEMTATAEAFAAQTQSAIEVTYAGKTATAEFSANQTLSAAQTATQEAIQSNQTQVALAFSLRGRLIDQGGRSLGSVGIRLYRDNGDGNFAPFSQDEFITLIGTAPDGTFDFGALEPGLYWLEVDYFSLPDDLRHVLSPNEAIVVRVSVPTGGQVEFEIAALPLATPTFLSPFDLTATVQTEWMTPNVTSPAIITPTSLSPLDLTATSRAEWTPTATSPAIVTLTSTSLALPTTGGGGCGGEVTFRGSLSYGESVSGQLDDTECFELWEFTGKPGDQVYIRMQGEDGLQPRLVITPPEGLGIVDEAGPGGTEAMISLTLTSDGTYQILAGRHVEGVQEVGSGPYTLELIALGMPVTPSATPVLQTPNPSVEVAFAEVPVRVRDISGAVIGDGTLRLFAPERVTYPEKAPIELELALDNIYITPTPAGPVAITPVVHITSTPLPGRPTSIPHLPIFEESGQTIYQRMGASLICSPDSFTGCDARADQKNLRRIDAGETTWVWSIKPQSEVHGLQDLRVELWTLELVEDVEVPGIKWSHAFSIEVNPEAPVVPAPRQPSNGGVLPGVVVGTVAAVVLVGIGLALHFARRRRRGPVIKIFISYQRRTGWATARTLRDRLEKMGADVFIDVEDIHEGRFAQIIEKAIMLCDHFVVVLAPGTLDSEWVRRESETAITHQKNIVPVLIEDFRFENVALAGEISALTNYNAVRLDPEYFEAAIQKLATFVKLRTP
jgi:hypothetical protein